MTVQIGRSIPRLEARAKLNGRIEYAHNLRLRLPCMLYVKLFRSTVADEVGSRAARDPRRAGADVGGRLARL
jgi:CO/xanthine dehydrogenase Mo-binding subunit